MKKIKIEKGVLTFDLNNPSQKRDAVALSFMDFSDQGEMLNKVFYSLPNLKEFEGQEDFNNWQKMEFVFDLVSNLKKQGYKIVKQ